MDPAHSTDTTLPLREDRATRLAYTSDASLFRLLPAAVAEPRNAAELRELLAYAGSRDLPVVARGGGTSVSGNAITDGLLIDTSRHWNRILEIDPQSRTATVEPGVICDALREAAAPYGLTFGPDPSTHARCTIGGMLGNNSCGSHSVLWGTTADNTIAVTLMLADGREVELRRGGTSDPELTAALRGLRDRHRALLRTELGRFGRQVSGYGMHHLLEEHGFDCARAVIGAEGTLGIVTKATVRLVTAPKHTALAVLGFADVFAAAAAGPRLIRDGVATVEGMGSDLLEALRSRPGKAQAGTSLPSGGGWLFCNVHGMTAGEAESRAHELTSLTDLGITDSVVVTETTAMRDLWAIRESAAGLATRLPDGGEAWPGWEDSAVPPENLADYLRELYALLDKHHLRGIPFGHFGEGCIHIRLSFNFDSAEAIAAYRDFLQEAAALVHRFDGSLAGEHSDGRARSSLLEAMYSPAMLSAFAEFKRCFDATGRLNPGVLAAPDGFHPDPVDENLRPGQHGPASHTIPMLAFARDGGSLRSAVNRCVGVGACRTTSGAMCPSFQATGDELHSTRGRARALSELLRGEAVPEGWASRDVAEALDMCLSCKACRTECPVSVDMAAYKAEFLFQHHGPGLRSFAPHWPGRRTVRRPLSHLIMGRMPDLLRVTDRLPGGLRVLMTASALISRAPALIRLLGLDAHRGLISFAPHSLRSRHRERYGEASGAGEEPASAESSRTVVLWPDTFSNYLDPDIGEAAIEVLERLGYRVVLPSGPVCCSLTYHSTGQLDAAQRVLTRTLNAMAPALAAGHPVITLEPSCSAMLSEEITEVLPDDPRAQQLAQAIVPFADFLERHRQHHLGAPWPLPEPTADISAPTRRQAVGQVHCHRQAEGSSTSDSALLAALGYRNDLTATGCCGLAGNWGFEPGHYEISRRIAEQRLAPAIRSRDNDAVVIADGLSCRTQIEHCTGVPAQHLAQVVRAAFRAAE